MDILDIMRKRYSVRAYKSDEVEEEKLQEVLEAARLAPTACNLQSFKICIIQTKGREDEIKKIYNRDWFTKAPLVLAVCSIPGTSWVRSDGKNYCYVDAAIVMDHMILAATAAGLGTCWIGAFNVQAARKVLGLDDTLEPVAFTPLGYAADSERPKVRKNLGEITIWYCNNSSFKTDSKKSFNIEKKVF